MNLDLLPIEHVQAEQTTKRQLKPFWQNIFAGLAAGLIIVAFSATDVITAMMPICLLFIAVMVADGFWRA